MNCFIKKENQIVLLKENLKKIFNLKHTNLVGQCREGIFYAVRFSIEKTGKKEVLVSSYTLYSVINMIILAGGTPIFLDTKKNSLQNSINEIKKHATQNTACIIITHIIDVNEQSPAISKFAKKNGIFLIEDCAVSLGGRTKNNELSCTFGDFGILSFQALKNIQCLNGGAIVSNQEEFYYWLEKKQNQLSFPSISFFVPRLLFVLFIDFLSRTKMQCKRVVKASHGINETFSTGSQNQNPPHPNS